MMGNNTANAYGNPGYGAYGGPGQQMLQPQTMVNNTVTVTQVEL